MARPTNPDTWYEGTLCKRNHNFEGKGVSLRYTKSKKCVECLKLINQSYFDRLKHDPDRLESVLKKRTEATREWEKKNPDKLQQYREANRKLTKAREKACSDVIKTL